MGLQVNRNAHRRMFIAALLIPVKNGNNKKYPSTVKANCNIKLQWSTI